MAEARCSEKYFVHCSVELLAVNGIRFYHSYVVQFNMLLPTLFYPAVTYLWFVSTCIDSLSLLFRSLSSLSDCPSVYQQPRERKIFDFFVARVVQKFTVRGNGPFSHILCSFLRATRRYIDRPERSRRNKMFQILVRGCRLSRA